MELRLEQKPKTLKEAKNRTFFRFFSRFAGYNYIPIGEFSIELEFRTGQKPTVLAGQKFPIVHSTPNIFNIVIPEI